MLRNHRLALAAVGLTLCGGATVSAQTNDHNWRSWAWMEDLGAARAAGMGGAFVAVADDSSAPVTNPAGMLLLEKIEISAGVLNRASGTLPNGDTTLSRTGIGYIGGAGKISERVAIGGYVTEPHDERIRLTTTGPVGGADAGSLDTTVTDAGAAVAWAPVPRLYLGLRLNVTHLRIQGLLNHVDGGASYDAGTAGSQDRIAGDAGALLKLSDRAQLGVAFVQGARWEAQRTAQNSAGAFSPITYQLSSPSRLSGGLSVRPTEKLLLAGQLDYVLLSRLRDTFLAVSPANLARSDYELDNVVDARAGAELSLPAGSVSVQLRGGVYSQGPRSFRYTATAPASEVSAFAGVTRRTVGTAGASLVTRSLRLDVGGVFGGERNVVVASAGVRF